jgi:predicted translin family RNA/ssDNA-binding protein
MNNVHAEIHKKIREVVESKHAGDLEAAEAAYQQVQVEADELGGLLDSLEMQADREAGH